MLKSFLKNKINSLVISDTDVILSSIDPDTMKRFGINQNNMIETATGVSLSLGGYDHVELVISLNTFDDTLNIELLNDRGIMGTKYLVPINELNEALVELLSKSKDEHQRIQ